MSDASGAVAAAVISAAVVAFTFSGTEFLRWRRDARSARVEALGRLLLALEKVPIHAAAVMSVFPWRRRVMPPDLELGFAAVYLYGVLPRRDWPFVRWVTWRLDAMFAAPPVERMVIGADISGAVTAYISHPRRAREYAKRFRSDVDAWFVGGEEGGRQTLAG